MQKRVLNVVGSVLMGLVCLTMAVACEGRKSKPARDVRPYVEDRIGIDAMKSRGYAVKLKVEDSLIVVYSRKGRNVRLDKFSGQDHTVLLFAPGGGLRNEWVYAAGKGWHKDEYRTEQSINNFFAEIITDQADVCLRHGYEPAGTTTVCDKLCAVYKGVFMADAGEKGKILREFGDRSKEILKDNFVNVRYSQLADETLMKYLYALQGKESASCRGYQNQQGNCRYEPAPSGICSGDG